MVHRPSDSRLLVNLIGHEKDYSKQLATLLEHSQSSLASFSAYASASAPPTSQIIIQVAGALAGADEGLRKYAASLEVWQDQLRSLKDLEDEVGNVMRDREILVTRLIKVSKNQKPTRDTLLATSGSSSSLSFVKPEVQLGSKLAAAQGELQACEAHLATKERELDMMRAATVRVGLQARCKALVECGWQWGEMGKEGLRALETLDVPNGMNGHAQPASQLPYNKPLPDSGQSDLSSIGPSQSASQNTHFPLDVPSAPKPYTLHIPPAHAITDDTYPNGTAAPLSHMDEQGSSDEEDSAQYEVRENERFSLKRDDTVTKSKLKGRDRSPPSSSSKVTFPASASAPVVTRNKPRQRQNSTGVFSSIAAFFHSSKSSNAGSDDEHNPYASEPLSVAKSNSRWKTRTDKRLSRSKGKDSSDDELPSMSYPRTLPPDPISTGQVAPSESSQRLKKRSTKRNTVQVAPKPQATTSEDKGWASDGGTPLQPNGTIKGKKKAKMSPKTATPGPSTSALTATNTKGKKGKEVEILQISGKNTPPSPVSPSSPVTSKGKKANGTALSATLPTEVSLSRNSSISRQSITSAASAPVNLSAQGTTIHVAPHRQSAHKRTTSLDASSPRPDTTKGHKKTASSNVFPRPGTVRASGEPSLMSIVEGVSKQNKDHAAQRDLNSMLFLPKAPPPVSASIDLDHLGEEPSPPADREPSERSVPLTPSVPPPSVPIIHHPSPDLKPLRSAMRNSSRSPSPQLSALAPLSPPVMPARSPLRPPPMSLTHEPQPMRKGGDDGDDASSISSYETTREQLEDEDSTPTPVQTFVTPPLPSAPPPVPSKQPEPAHAVGGSDVSQSTSSSTGTGAPTRRKSVRMSLPPTFSATPPALDEDAEPARRYEPWASPPNGHARPNGNGAAWGSRVREERDLWQDSSDEEDEEYSKAKRLLSRLGKKSR